MFNYKVYDIDWTYKFTINLDDIKSEPSFSANNLWGQWQLSLALNYSFDNNKINNTDVIKMYKDTVLVYTWIVQNLQRIITNTHDEIVLPLLWLWTLPTYLLYKSGGVYQFNKTADPSVIVKDIIDYINTIYTTPWLNYNWTSITTYWVTINVDFDNETCLSALLKVAKATNYYLYTDQSWQVFFRAKPVTPTHKLTVWDSVEQINLEDDSEELVNKLILTWSGGTDIYDDLTSQAAYGVREKYLEDTDIKNQATADEYWDNYILENKDLIQKTKVIVNKNYNLESLNVWDTIIIQNFKYIISNLQIVKLSYSPDKVMLELEVFDSFGKEIQDFSL